LKPEYAHCTTQKVNLQKFRECSIKIVDLLGKDPGAEQTQQLANIKARRTPYEV